MQKQPMGHYRRRLGFGAYCDECREPFHTTRKDARFCSARCRQRARRGRLLAERIYAQMYDR